MLYNENLHEEEQHLIQQIAEQTERGKIGWELTEYNPLSFLNEDKIDKNPAVICQSFSFEAIIGGSRFELDVMENIDVPSGIPIYNSWPPERQREMFEDCQGSLCRALFNKNAADGFWCLFENTYQLIIVHPDEPVQQLFVRLQALGDCVSRCPDFDAISLKYFISVVKDGIQQ